VPFWDLYKIFKYISISYRLESYYQKKKKCIFKICVHAKSELEMVVFYSIFENSDLNQF